MSNTLFLTSYPSDRKVTVIKLIRELTECTLLEAKNALDLLPFPLKVNADTQTKVQALFENIGATVEVQPLLPPTSRRQRTASGHRIG